MLAMWSMIKKNVYKHWPQVSMFWNLFFLRHWQGITDNQAWVFTSWQLFAIKPRSFFRKVGAVRCTSKYYTLSYFAGTLMTMKKFDTIYARPFFISSRNPGGQPVDQVSKTQNVFFSSSSLTLQRNKLSRLPLQSYFRLSVIRHWNIFEQTNTLAYFASLSMTARSKRFYKLTPGCFDSQLNVLRQEMVNFI